MLVNQARQIHTDVGPGSWVEFDFGEAVWVKEIWLWDHETSRHRGWPLDFFVHDGPAHQKQPGMSTYAIERVPRAGIKDGTYRDSRTSPATTFAFGCGGTGHP